MSKKRHEFFRNEKMGEPGNVSVLVVIIIGDYTIGYRDIYIYISLFIGGYRG